MDTGVKVHYAYVRGERVRFSQIWVAKKVEKLTGVKSRLPSKHEHRLDKTKKRQQKNVAQSTLSFSFAPLSLKIIFICFSNKELAKKLII